MGFFGAGADRDRAERGQESLMAAREYLSGLIAQRRQKPGADLISILISHTGAE